MHDYSSTPVEMFATLWRHRQTIKAMARHEVLTRYRDSLFGLIWSFLNPLLTLVVFTFVFSVIFQARWGGGTGSKTEFALVLFAGLLVFNLFSEYINRAPSLILSNPNYVKKVIFPIEILPMVSLLSALFHASISLVVWLLAYTLFFGIPHLTALYLPIIILPFCLFLMGLSWALSALAVFLRDVSQLIGLLTTALMFLSPILYPVDAFPETYRYILYLNPLTVIVEQFREVLFWGRSPDFYVLGIYSVFAFSVAYLGFKAFQNMREGFSDVL